jgi:hypothetical protein
MEVQESPRYLPLRDKTKEELKRKIRELEEELLRKNVSSLPKIFDEFNNIINKVYESSLQLKLISVADEGIRGEILGTHRYITELGKKCLEAEYKIPDLKKLRSYKEIRQSISNLSNISNFMENGISYYGSVVVSSVAESILMASIMSAAFDPIGGIVGFLTGIMFGPLLNLLLIDEIQKRRYISAAEKMYKNKDIFFDEVKNLYKIT